MAIFRLDPITLDDVRWEASTVKESLWVCASTAARARQLVAAQTLPVNGAKLHSPWLVDALTTCEREPWTRDVPVGTVIRADAREGT